MPKKHKHIIYAKKYPIKQGWVLTGVHEFKSNGYKIQKNFDYVVERIRAENEPEVRVRRLGYTKISPQYIPMWVFRLGY